ncbi:MAG: hypothetical protein H6854_04840 [Rhodospirillales bacterium]|nr:hypothetical protein [Rhodospirillales bacterium]
MTDFQNPEKDITPGSILPLVDVPYAPRGVQLGVSGLLSSDEPTTITVGLNRGYRNEYTPPEGQAGKMKNSEVSLNAGILTTTSGDETKGFARVSLNSVETDGLWVAPVHEVIDGESYDQEGYHEQIDGSPEKRFKFLGEMTTNGDFRVEASQENRTFNPNGVSFAERVSLGVSDDAGGYACMGKRAAKKLNETWSIVASGAACATTKDGISLGGAAAVRAKIPSTGVGMVDVFDPQVEVGVRTGNSGLGDSGGRIIDEQGGLYAKITAGF